MKPKKKVKKAVWKGWAIKNIKSGGFARIYLYEPMLSSLKKRLEDCISTNEKVVKVEVREV